MNARQKGARGERDAAQAWQRILGVPAIRGQQRSGLEQADVVGVSDRLHIEVKRRKRFSVWSFVEQMRRDKDEGQLGVLMLRPDGDKEWHVMVGIESLVPFCKEIMRLAAGKDNHEHVHPQRKPDP